MISKKQMELDKIKWEMGQQLGTDPCGTFKYCERCKREEENPCEKALKRYQDSQRQKEKRQKNKQKINGFDFRATVVNQE